MKKVKIFGVNIASLSEDELEKEFSSCMLGEKQICNGKINTEFLLRAKRDDVFRKTLEDFGLNIADGAGVLWAAKYLSLPITKKPILREIQAIWQMFYTGVSLIFAPKYCTNPICVKFPGVEALYLTLETAEKEKAPVYILGSKQEVLEKAIINLKKQMPKLIIAGSHEGYFFDQEKIVKEINNSGAKVLIVALGSPKQEYWIKENLHKLAKVRLLVGEGGSLDRVANPRAKSPKAINRIGLEWLWRLFANKSLNEEGSRPKRIWNAVPVFIYEVVKDKIENGAIKVDE